MEDEVEVLQNIDLPLSDIISVGPNELNCNMGSIVLDGEGSTPTGNISFDYIINAAYSNFNVVNQLLGLPKKRLRGYSGSQI